MAEQKTIQKSSRSRPDRAVSADRLMRIAQDARAATVHNFVVSSCGKTNCLGIVAPFRFRTCAGAAFLLSSSMLRGGGMTTRDLSPS